MHDRCVMCRYLLKSNTENKHTAIEKFIASVLGIITYKPENNVRYIMCNGHIAIYSQYFPCRISNGKPRLNSNAINAILHCMSGGRFCTYVDPHGIMHIRKKRESMIDYFAKICLLEWGHTYYKSFHRLIQYM